MVVETIKNIKLMNKEKIEQLRWLLADFYVDFMEEFNITDIRAFNRIFKLVKKKQKR